MYNYDVDVKGFNEGRMRLVLKVFEYLCGIWYKFVDFGTQAQTFLRGKVQTNCKESKEPKESKVDNDVYQVEHIIPKPKGMAIFGTFFDFRTAGGAEQLHYYIDGRHYLLGDIFQEQLAGSSENYVFVASASLMRSVFLYEGQYPRHPLPDAWKLYNKHFNCQRGLFFMDGEEWFHNRRILNRFLLTGNLSWMDEHIKASTCKLIQTWKQQTTNVKGFYEVPEIEQQLFRWAVDVICTVMFGQIAIECPKLEEKLEIFSKIVRNVFEKSTALMNFPSKLAKLLHLRMWRDFEQNVKKVLCVGSEIIDMFVALNDDSTTLPCVDESVSLFSLLEDAKMPLSMIKRIFVDLVIAAGDTTAYSSVWALSILSLDPALQRKLAKDVLTEPDTSPLVRGLIKETLRLYPVAAFIGRYMATDAVIEGYRIPKDTLVLLSLFTAGRDDRHFEQPFHIIPERWIPDPKTGEFSGKFQAHASLPFAIGSRSCIGRKIAMKQMHCLLSQVISNFQIKYLCNELLEPILRMVTVPHIPLRIALKNR